MREFFRTNYLLLSFGHGLVFFLLGFAIAITLRNSPKSRLRLARSLNFVAAFGVLYGLAEWGATFIPLQSAYLPDETLLVLRVLRLVVLVGSFTALGWFGHSLLAPVRGLPAWLKAIPPVAALVWFGGLILDPLLRDSIDTQRWLYTWEMAARFLMGIPATVVGALALWEQRQALLHLGFKAARGYLRGAALTMVIVALTGGLIDPRPMAGSLALDRDVLFRAAGVPLDVIRASAGLALAIFFVLVLEGLAFDTRRRLDEADLHRAVLEERHRIGQELQDGVLQRIYAAALCLEGASALLTNNAKQAREHLDSALAQLDDTIRYIREHLVAGGGLPLRMSHTGIETAAPADKASGEAGSTDGRRRDGADPDSDR